MIIEIVAQSYEVDQDVDMASITINGRTRSDVQLKQRVVRYEIRYLMITAHQRRAGRDGTSEEYAVWGNTMVVPVPDLLG